MDDRKSQDQLFYDQLNILTNMNLEKMSHEERQQWQEHIDDIKTRYQDARAKEDNAALKEEERAYAGKVGESIAGALPAVTSGIISAQRAFANGDYLAGSAAIMDICTSAARSLPTLLAPLARKACWLGRCSP